MSAARKYRFPNGSVVTVNAPFYPTSCDKCGWFGSSEDCGTDAADQTGCCGDVYCPKCHADGADCGREGERAVLIGEAA